MHPTRIDSSATRRALACAILSAATSLAATGVQDPPAESGLHAPVRVVAGGEPIAVEAPGFAFPAWHDTTGDGRADLIVGQFAGGKMRIFPRAADGSLGAGRWLKATGDVAQVPGVW